MSGFGPQVGQNATLAAAAEVQCGVALTQRPGLSLGPSRCPKMGNGHWASGRGEESPSKPKFSYLCRLALATFGLAACDHHIWPKLHLLSWPKSQAKIHCMPLDLPVLLVFG